MPSATSKQAEAYRDEKENDPNATLPAYSDSVQPPAIEGLTAAFTNLSIPSNNPSFPNAPLAIVHLKLLYAFAALKEEIGFTDGLFDLWDSHATADQGFKNETNDPTSEALAMIREKRWALYVARATDRFATYWTKVLLKTGDTRLTQKYMLQLSFEAFPAAGRPIAWNIEMLPPLGQYVF